jgi:hypothetical protein
MTTIPPNEENNNTESADLKTREQWLRDEVRTHRAILFSLLQWGMALLIGIESALYFIRQGVAQGLTGQQFVIPAKVISWERWSYGTGFLALVAFLFTILTVNLLKRYASYREQLLKVAPLYSKIDDSPFKKNYQWIPLLFFWAVPIIDFGAWVAFHK